MTAQKMSAQEIIAFIGNAEKKTNVKVTFEGKLATAVPASVTKLGNVLFGDWKDIEPLLANLTENKDYVVEQDGRNSAVPLLDKRHLNARIEPGAIIRDQVEIGDNAVIMMGAVINIGAEIGSASENELTYTANRVQIFVGGYEYLLVDRLSQILRIDGKDYMSDINKLL